MSVLSFIEWNSCVCLVFQEAMEKMAKVGKVVQPDIEVQRWGILQQERKRLTLMPSLCLIIDIVVGYFRNEIWNIQQASNLSHDFLYFFLFFSFYERKYKVFLRLLAHQRECQALMSQRWQCWWEVSEMKLALCDTTVMTNQERDVLTLLLFSV